MIELVFFTIVIMPVALLVVIFNGITEIIKAIKHKKDKPERREYDGKS